MHPFPTLLVILLAASLGVAGGAQLRGLLLSDTPWRGAETADGHASGIAHVVLLNDSGGAVTVDRLSLGGTELLAGAAAVGASDRREFAFDLALLTETGEIEVTRPDGTRQVAPVVLDRRRPQHCRVGVWIRADRVEASPCAGFDPREVGASRRLDARRLDRRWTVE